MGYEIYSYIQNTNINKHHFFIDQLAFVQLAS